MKPKGKIYLVPVPIAQEAWHTLPAEVISITARLQHYFAENAKTCRQHLRGLHADLPLAPIQIETISKQGEWSKETLYQWLQNGYDVGIMSESGMAAIADPGASVVQWAHENNFIIKPLSGPSSILLALSASGCSGQQFCFLGYLPLESRERAIAVKKLEQRSLQNKEAQIFIETPYRNQVLFQELLKHLSNDVRLCVAFHITSDEEFIKTQKVKQWKQQNFSWTKAPAIFIVQAN